MTNEELDAFEAKARAATQGPWACSENVRDIFGVEPLDWWIIYARNPDRKSSFPTKTVCRMYPCATAEEIDTARKAFLHGEETRDPGQAGADAAYIAAANPAVILELIAELRQARKLLQLYV